MKKEFYRAREAAEYLGVGLSTIWLWNKQGKLSSQKLSPRVTVFPLASLNQFIDDTSKGKSHD